MATMTPEMTAANILGGSNWSASRFFSRFQHHAAGMLAGDEDGSQQQAAEQAHDALLAGEQAEYGADDQGQER